MDPADPERRLSAAPHRKIIHIDMDAFYASVEAAGSRRDRDAECERRSREFQDAISGRRVANPPILPLIYWATRRERRSRKAGVASNLAGGSG
jgi:hypothetical protein